MKHWLLLRSQYQLHATAQHTGFLCLGFFDDLSVGGGSFAFFGGGGLNGFVLLFNLLEIA
jgi:hypothetical protein